MLKFENKMSNTYTKKMFSSANCSILLCFISAIIIYLFIEVNLTPPSLGVAVFEVICLGTMLIGSSLCFYIKFPLFIEPNPTKKFSEDVFEQKYEQNLNWFKCLYFILFTAERSEFVSFFSGATLRLYAKGRVCEFIWENKPVKPIHRILDFLLLLILAPIFCLLVAGLLNFGIISGISGCIIGLLFLFRKRILFNILSINVGKKYDYKLNVMYPYSNIKFHLYKYYGVAEPFTKTILISEDTYRMNPIIKEYVTTHEAGHLKDKKIFWTHFFIPIFVMLYLSLFPYLLITFNSLAAFIPLLTYFIYKVTLGYKIREKVEFSADEFALKTIGKEKCIEALTLMNADTNNRSNNKNFLIKTISLERKIQFINDYEEKN